MAEETLISWADHTFNPWIGCTRVSPACDGCYAAHLMETRMGRVEWGGPGKGSGTRARTSEANWRKPLTWDRKAAAAGNRPFVFCSSLADVFDNEVPKEWRSDLFDLIERTPNLIWLLLTKRPQNIVKLAIAAGGLPTNAAVGTTVEDQARAINLFRLAIAARETGALFTFCSFEPLIERVDPTRIVVHEGPAEFYAHPEIKNIIMTFNALAGAPSMKLPPLGWAITGGETDQGAHKARPSHPDWFRSLRDQCAAAGVPFHFKQWGEWVQQVGAVDGWSINDDHEISRFDHRDWEEGAWGDPYRPMWCDDRDDDTVSHIGKKQSGRSLDGVEHNAFPAIRRMA